MKRLIAAILSLAMLFTLCPVFPVYAEETIDGVVFEGYSDGIFTDEEALGSESYEYTISGSDGSSYTLTTYAVPDYTGNNVTPGFEVVTDGLEALVHQINPTNNYLKQDDYTDSTWNSFTSVLSTANALIVEMDGKVFDSASDANAALARVDQAYADLLNAVLNLDVDVVKELDSASNQYIVKAGEEAIPSIVWQRTKESRTDSGDTITNVQTINPPDYSKIEWNFDDVSNVNGSESSDTVKSLKTDPTMILWDYGNEWYGYPSSEAEYQDAVEGLRASTWSEFESPQDWTAASVRLISGQFIWPEGFDLDDSAVIESAEDADYKPIYDYINSNAELKAEFEGDKVLPLNDDVFFFIRKQNEELTETNYLDHLVFWSGTSGKGVWSSVQDLGSGDWDRTELPSYQGQTALPAFYGVLPNLGFHTGTHPTQATDGSSTDFFGQMEHTDKWYTIADTDAVMSTMRNLYGSVAAGDVFVIDMYCFDNSGTGGMDPLELKLIKNAETTATVRINYYLNEVSSTSDTEHYLGTSYLTGQTVGAQLFLSEGTGTGQLNYRKASAVAAAGTKVSDGVQTNAPYIVKESDNVINVIYIEGWPTTHFTYDFALNNLFTIKLDQSESISNIDSVEFTTDGETTSEISLVNYYKNQDDGKWYVFFNYMPEDAMGKYINSTLTITYDNVDGTVDANYAESLFIYPASNVLYDRAEYIKPADNSGWEHSGTVDASDVSDNESTAYGYTDEYQASISESGQYTVTLDNDDSTNLPRFSGDLTFDFYGNGFDLIGACGPETGTMMVRLNNKDTGAFVRAYVVDTAYDGTYGKLYQVPLVHEQGLDEGSYTVTVRAAYVNYSRSARSAIVNTTNDVLEELMQQMGLTESQMEDVVFINMDRLIRSAGSGARTTTSETPATMTVEFDGFRVYRRTNNSHYADKERNLIYTNVMVDGVDRNLTAYLEGGTDTVLVSEYENKGGPQNEVYLEKSTTEKNSALAIQLSNGATYAQVSLRAVGSVPAKFNNGTEEIEISHNTEMYYEVSVSDGLIVITNTGDGMLAVGNIKSNGTISSIGEPAINNAKTLMLHIYNPNVDEDINVPEETEPEESKPVETEPEESKPVETEPEESKPVETEPEESKPEETEPEESKPEETEPEETKPEENPFDPNKVELPFKDVEKGKWFYDGVAYVYHHKLMNGMKNDEFGPGKTMTRAMVATVLYRLAGSPETDYDAKYSDIPANKYYTDAVNWAAEKGIAFGVGGNKFDPNGDVTREQLATMLYRYSQMMNYDMETEEDLLDFPDFDQVNKWSKDGMKWAVGKGIINGVKNVNKNELQPGANALRSQIAVILQRFCESFQ